MMRSFPSGQRTTTLMRLRSDVKSSVASTSKRCSSPHTDTCGWAAAAHKCGEHVKALQLTTHIHLRMGRSR
eukprot:365507-Chlamydomonas_euryale.AAC.3